MASATPREGSARGPEVLAYGQPGGISWRACQMTYEELMAIYPAAATRGVRQNTTFYEINSTPMLSVYPELAFHDNGADAQWLVENQGAIAEALCRGVCRWFGVNYAAPAGEDWQQRYLSLRQSLQALLEENPAQI